MSAKVELQRVDYVLATEMASRGCNEASIAKALQVSPATFKALKKRDEALAAAVEVGRAIEHDHLVGVLRKAADDGYPQAAMFLLKARHGYREQGPDTSAVQAVAVNITLPAARSREDYERELAIDVTPIKESKP
jgi:hypothetical protein